MVLIYASVISARNSFVRAQGWNQNQPVKNLNRLGLEISIPLPETATLFVRDTKQSGHHFVALDAPGEVKKIPLIRMERVGRDFFSIWSSA